MQPLHRGQQLEVLWGTMIELPRAALVAGEIAEVAEAEGVDVPATIGTMIEVPRAVLTAGEIAGAADFFSFGTNDLTQMTWGFSRDDVEAAFFLSLIHI